LYRVLKNHGVTGANIKKGYRSPLSSKSESVPVPLPLRLAQEEKSTNFYLRVMTLEADELAKEAKELRDDGFGYALIYAVTLADGMEVAIERLRDVWPGSLNAKSKMDRTAIIEAAGYGIAANVNTLATMGSDLSHKETNGYNVFAVVSPHDKASKKVLAEHGVTSAKIPRGFQSPLYFSSIYYEKNLRTQRWLNRCHLILCANYLYNWSVENQVEDQFHRTLPADLSSVGHFVAHCFFDVAGGDFGNGIARLITEYYGGFDEGTVKKPIKLIGMPAFGKSDHSLPSCSYCNTEYCEANGGGVKLCCEKVHYCRDGDCKKRAWRNHESICVSDEIIERRKREAVEAEVRKKESAKANDKAEEAAASLLAELGLEEEGESNKKKKKKKSTADGGEQEDLNKKSTEKGGKNKKKK
jgi:hypothetical protein